MKLFLVGQYREGGTGETVWDFQGIFDAIEKAEKACIKDNYFVAPVNLNEELPEKTSEWEGVYYPNIQGSEL